MNQILLTEKNNKQNYRGNSIDLKRMIIVFSILIIVFAIVILIAKFAGKNRKGKIISKPQVQIEQLENEKCKVSINYNTGIESVSYWWNSEKEKITKNINGETQFNVEIDIPENCNEIHVTAKGTDGKQNEFIKEMQFEPQVDLYYDGNSVIKITAKYRNGLKSIQYHWENEEAQIVEVNGENEKTVSLAASRGTNRLYVTVVGQDEKIIAKEQNFVGVLEPEINFSIEEGNILVVNIKHDKGFKKIILRVGEEEAIYDENYPDYSEEQHDITSKIPLQQGRTDIEVIVYTLEQPEKAYSRQRYTQIP